MTYILNEKIGLRSWWRVPYAYYVKSVRNAKKLTKEEFELLSLCDGHTEIENSELLTSLLERGFISAPRECERANFPLAREGTRALGEGVDL